MNAASVKMRKKKKLPLSAIITYLVLFAYLCFIMAPFLVIIFTSFMSDYELGATLYHFFPYEWVVDGYIYVFTLDPNMINGISSLLIGFVNTMWQTLIPGIVGLFVSTLTAFIYSKYKFPGRKVFFMVNAVLMTLPLGAFGFVGYLFYMNIGWVGGMRGILPILIPGMFGGCGTIFFLRMYYDSALSNEIVEAAKLDGAGHLRLFFSIALPLAKPAILAQFLFIFIGGYNSYGAALMYLYPEKSMWNLQLALSELTKMLAREGNGHNEAQCAAAIISMLPLIILYVFLQKQFIEGINIGGSKE